MSDEPDRELAYLLGRVARGDAAAYSTFYDRVAGPVYGLAMRMLNNDRSAAEEVVQEVLVEAWRSAAKFDATKGSVMTWVMTLAHRRAVDRVRRERSYAERNERERRLVTHPDLDPGEQVEVEESRERVRAALSTLPEPQREALVLAYFGGHSYPEVAAQLGVPLGTVKTRVRQGMMRLKERLEEHR
jgi:RNA polymerase sigma-70 factor (ECF subfamily)